MTGNVATIAGTTFSRSVARMPPAVVNPILWSFLGGSLAQSQNLVPGGVPLRNIGAGPLYPPPGNYARFTFGGVAALDLPVADVAGSVTVLVVARTIESNGYGALISNFVNTPANAGVDFYLNNNLGLGAFLAGSGISWGNLPQPAGSQYFSFLAIARQSGVDGTMYNKTAGLSLNAPGVSARTLSSAFWQLGQNPAGTRNQANVDIAFAGICQSYLDATAMDNAYQSVRETLALTGMRI